MSGRQFPPEDRAQRPPTREAVDLPESVRAPSQSAPAAPHDAPPDTQAVAVDYDPDSGELPQVVATGRGYVAEQILALAFEHGVKVRKDADLVQILSAIDIDSDIPPEAFTAVAEILAYLYKANQTLAEASGKVSPSKPIFAKSESPP